ncbi:MAG: GtrA family protein [bacterium]
MERLLREYYRYIIVGLLITALDFSMLTVQVEFFNIYYLLAVGLSFSLASVLHYYLSANWIFVQSTAPKNLQSFFIFFIIGVTGLCILEGLMFFFVEIIDLHYLFAKVFATGIIFSFNFLAKRFLLFR